MRILPDLSTVPKRPIIIVVGVIVVGGFIYLIVSNIGAGEQGLRAELTMWGVLQKWEAEIAMQSYASAEPGVTITYTQFDENVYEKALVNAMAAGKGPDVFMLRNRWLPKEIDKISPPDVKQIGIGQLRNLFPSVVEQDFSSNQRVYALPLYIDTLLLIYNKNHLDQNGIAQPPATWQEFEKIIPALRIISSTGQINRAAAAIGGSRQSIATAVDVLNLLMMQNGTPMVNPRSKEAQFVAGAKGDSGVAALNFYLKFANIGTPFYTWNDNQGDYLENFIAGKASVIFDYGARLNEIRKRAPFLKYVATKMPQPADAEADVNFADYWGLTVSRQSRNQFAAWDFIIHATTDVEASRSFMSVTGRLSALRTLIGELVDDPQAGFFARQALTARSWHQADDTEIQTIFSNAIRRVLTGQTNSRTALVEAEEQVNDLIRQSSFGELNP